MDKKPLDIVEVQQLHQQGRLAEAKQGYLAILAANPQEVLAHHMLALLLAEEGDLDAALSSIQQALALQSGDPVLGLHLANMLKAKGLYNEAIQALLEVTTTHPNFAAAHNNLGTAYYALEKWHAARNAYQTAINIQPDYVDAYYNLGLALTKSGHSEEAINAYRAVIELAPLHPGGRFQLGCLLLQQNKYAQAIEQFSFIERQHPFHFETQSNLATGYLKTGKLLEAKSHYLKALEMMPNDMQILFNLGVISMQLGRPQKAIEFYTRALAINGQSFEAHNNLAVAYLSLRNMETALEHFRAALHIQPNNEAVRHMVGVISREKNVSVSPPEYIRSLFDSYADHYDAHITQSLHYRVPELIYQLLKDAKVLEQQSRDILDIGCGTGLCGELLKAHAHSLVGVDISEKMLAIAQQKNIYSELVQADILPYLTQAQAAYDLIIAGDVLVYFGDLTAVFSGVHKSLRSKGYFAFNAEISDKEDYHMTASGRFSHSKTYLDGLIAANHFTILNYKVVDMRQQNDNPVRGHLYLLSQ